ncbi:MAG: MraY family glycosyltransferase [Acidobacteria bacterium]|nr:MraY family glycosyltransferase [Acidobacteriota bacterium]
MRFSAGELIAVVLCVAICSAFLNYLLARWSAAWGLVATPSESRWHKLPTPNTGGIGILASCALAYFLLVPGEHPVLAAAALVLGMAGMLDDRLSFPPGIKLVCQSVCALVVLASGLVLPVSPWNGANVAITFLWLIGITNATNLIDNMDGLCGGVIAIIALFRICAAFSAKDGSALMMLAILAGGYGGFLVLNWKPARIFMGDCGSMFGGFSLAALCLVGNGTPAQPSARWLGYLALTFLYPVFDTFLVSFVRTARGQSIATGGRDHSSHILVRSGLSERLVVGLIWVVTAGSALAGLFVYPLAVR